MLWRCSVEDAVVAPSGKRFYCNNVNTIRCQWPSAAGQSGTLPSALQKQGSVIRGSWMALFGRNGGLQHHSAKMLFF